MFHQPFRHIKIGMTFFFFFLFHLEANALVYRVHVNYPYGSGEPRDNQYDTKKDDRKQSVWLKYSKFTCETEAADFEKSFAMTISCKKRGEDSSFESTAICGESVKFTTDSPIMRLKETPPKNSMLKIWEHTISIECDPGKPTTLETVLKQMNKKPVTNE